MFISSLITSTLRLNYIIDIPISKFNFSVVIYSKIYFFKQGERVK